MGVITWLGKVGRSDEGHFLTLPSRIGRIIPSPLPVPFPLSFAGKRWQELEKTPQSAETVQVAILHVEDEELTQQPWTADCYMEKRSTSILVSHHTLECLCYSSQASTPTNTVTTEQALWPQIKPLPTAWIWYIGAVFFILSICNMGHILRNECFFYIISFNSPNSPMWLVPLLSHFKDEETDVQIYQETCPRSRKQVGGGIRIQTQAV